MNAAPLYIQEKVRPQAIVEELLRQSAQSKPQSNWFSQFNGLSANARTEFYQHEGDWQNRMILGDNLQVIDSLAEREELAGQVQYIYFAPPYSIHFNSNFQWLTTSRAVQDGDPNHILREPEQVKVLQDSWRHGIHSYLAYIRDRLTLARDVLSTEGIIIGENPKFLNSIQNSLRSASLTQNLMNKFRQTQLFSTAD